MIANYENKSIIYSQLHVRLSFVQSDRTCVIPQYTWGKIQDTSAILFQCIAFLSRRTKRISELHQRFNAHWTSLFWTDTPASFSKSERVWFLCNACKSSEPPMDLPRIMTLGKVEWWVRRVRRTLSVLESAGHTSSQKCVLFRHEKGLPLMSTSIILGGGCRSYLVNSSLAFFENLGKRRIQRQAWQNCSEVYTRAKSLFKYVRTKTELVLFWTEDVPCWTQWRDILNLFLLSWQSSQGPCFQQRRPPGQLARMDPDPLYRPKYVDSLPSQWWQDRASHKAHLFASELVECWHVITDMLRCLCLSRTPAGASQRSRWTLRRRRLEVRGELACDGWTCECSRKLYFVYVRHSHGRACWCWCFHQTSITHYQRHNRVLAFLCTVIYWSTSHKSSQATPPYGPECSNFPQDQLCSFRHGRSVLPLFSSNTIVHTGSLRLDDRFGEDLHRCDESVSRCIWPSMFDDHDTQITFIRWDPREIWKRNVLGNQSWLHGQTCASRFLPVCRWLIPLQRNGRLQSTYCLFSRTLTCPWRITCYNEINYKMKDGRLQSCSQASRS